MLNRTIRCVLMRLVLVPIVCVMLSAATAVAATCNADSTGATNAANDIQACLDAGGTVSLVAGGTYLIGTTLRIDVPGTLFTSDGAARAVLRASTTLEGGILVGETPIAWPATTVERIAFVGRKIYGHNRFNLSDPGNCGGIGSSVSLKGLYLVNDVESSHAICGTAFSIEGAFVFENSHIHDNGWDTNSSWADGITVQGCTEFGPYRGEVRNNLVENNTDVGLITGGGPCQVYSNQIHQTNIYAFAGLMVGWFPGGAGNHAGANYYSNTITSSYDRLAYGLMVGFEPWWGEVFGYDAYVPNAGTVTGNSISGAVVNLAIEGIGTGSVQGNTIGFAQGTRAFFCNTSSKPYTAHLFGTASIQGGWEPFWFFQSRCGFWNTSLPQPDNPGALAHGRRLMPDQSLYSPTGNYRLLYQLDGNLVLYNAAGDPVWWNPGAVGSPSAVIMQEDANFVVYSGTVWSTATSNWDKQGAYFVVQDDGNLVVYYLDGSVLWSRFQ